MDEKDYLRCVDIVRKELTRRNILVDENVLERIVQDVLNISYAKGGGCSNEIVEGFAAGYIGKGLHRKFLCGEN